MVMANDPESIALFFALGSSRTPVILLSPDARAWRTTPPIAAGTPLYLTPCVERLAAAARPLGLEARRLGPPPARRGAAASIALDSRGGVVTFTSGSTGTPRPVYWTHEGLATEVAGIIRGYALTPGPGVVGTLPLSGAHGLTDALLVAAALNSPLGLVREFDHRTVLALLASGSYQYWAVTPVMADIISRCPLTGSVPPAPRVCPVGGARVHEEVFHRFRRRFGVSLRPEYGSTENGTISGHMGTPDDAIRPRTVGRPAPGVEIVVGSPGDPLPAGSPGRIWLRSPWRMEGYGFPPHLQGGADAEATGPGTWVPTPDLGQIDEDGYLTLLGRIDDCFKTLGGHLVHPDEIAEALRGHPGVTDAEVVALDRGSGHLIGAVVEGSDSVSAADLHAHVCGSLPAWKRPQAIIVTRALPRLPRGKTDRRECAGLLEAALRQQR